MPKHLRTIEDFRKTGEGLLRVGARPGTDTTIKEFGYCTICASVTEYTMYRDSDDRGWWIHCEKCKNSFANGISGGLGNHAYDRRYVTRGHFSKMPEWAFKEIIRLSNAESQTTIFLELMRNRIETIEKGIEETREELKEWKKLERNLRKKLVPAPTAQ